MNWLKKEEHPSPWKTRCGANDVDALTDSTLASKALRKLSAFTSLSEGIVFLDWSWQSTRDSVFQSFFLFEWLSLTFAFRNDFHRFTELRVVREPVERDFI